MSCSHLTQGVPLVEPVVDRDVLLRPHARQLGVDLVLTTVITWPPVECKTTQDNSVFSFDKYELLRMTNFISGSSSAEPGTVWGGITITFWSKEQLFLINRNKTRYEVQFYTCTYAKVIFYLFLSVTSIREIFLVRVFRAGDPGALAACILCPGLTGFYFLIKSLLHIIYNKKLMQSTFILNWTLTAKSSNLGRPSWWGSAGRGSRTPSEGFWTGYT